MPPQNVSLWHADYFKLRTIKAQKSQEEPWTFVLTARKNVDRGHVPERESSPLITTV